MSEPVDKHIAKAFASLDNISRGGLEATAEALEHRRNGLRDFASVFREVAWARESGSEPSLASYHVRDYIRRGDADLLERLAEAEAPFWRHCAPGGHRLDDED